MKRREYPKTVLRKKVIKGFFWTVFGMMLFLSVVSIVRVANAGSDAADEQPVKEERRLENPAASVGAQSFAESFAGEYFQWENSDEAIKERAERLKPYLANDLDEQAGLSFEGMEQDSELTETQVWNVEEQTNDTAIITLRVKHTLKKTTPPDAKAIEAAKKAKKPLPEAKTEKSEPFEKFLAVPVKSDGESYAVHKVPYFVPPAKKTEINADNAINDEGNIQDSKLKSEVTQGLNTFFKVYTTGSEEELSYYTKNDEIKPMTGIIVFKELKDAVVKQGDASNEYRVHATAVFEEGQSKAKVTYPYEFVLVKEEDRLFVKEMKNE